jgi:hypothetical protein
MKNTFLATLIAMLFALSFVSCDKDDDPKHVLYADSIVNALPFKIALNIDQWFVNLNESEGKDFFKIKPDDQGVVMLNADIAYKGGEFRKDSMIVVKDYPLVPVNKEIDKGSSTIYSVNYYIITEEVFRDIIAKMKEQGIEPEKYDENIFNHVGKVFGYYNYKNTSSYDIRITDPISATIKRGEDVSIHNDDGMRLHVGKNSKYVMPLDCTLYFADKETSYSLEVSGFEWEVSDFQSFTEGLDITDTFYFIFTDELLESIKSFMADKNVFPVETEFPKE